MITLEPEAISAWATNNNQSLSGIHENDVLINEIQDWVDNKVNALFARVEHVRKFTLFWQKTFAIDKGELTPTMKIKRRIIYANYEEAIEAMYQD